MNQRQFGRHSESCLSDIDGQISLFDSFNETEHLQQNAPEEPEISEVVILSYRRSKAKGKRESDLEGRPSRVFEHKLSEEKLTLKFPNGYKELSVRVYKRLHIIPETFIVDEHHVHVYVSKNNDSTIIRVPSPKDLLRDSIATPALVASIINGKQTYMWIYRDRPLHGSHPVVLYDWQPSRRADPPREFLKTFSGTVATDGYQIYHKLAK